MIFLIEYDRNAGRLIAIRDFEAPQREQAEDSRMKLELDLSQRGLDHEVVLLEAQSRDELQQTHRRYFVDLVDLLESGIKAPRNGDHPGP